MLIVGVWKHHSPEFESHYQTQNLAGKSLKFRKIGICQVSGSKITLPLQESSKRCLARNDENSARSVRKSDQKVTSNKKKLLLPTSFCGTLTKDVFSHGNFFQQIRSRACRRISLLADADLWELWRRTPYYTYRVSLLNPFHDRYGFCALN